MKIPGVDFNQSTTSQNISFNLRIDPQNVSVSGKENAVNPIAKKKSPTKLAQRQLITHKHKIGKGVTSLLLCSNGKLFSGGYDGVICGFVYSKKGFKLQNMMKEYADSAFEIGKKPLEFSDIDILSSNIGLRCLCQAKLLKEYSEEQAVDFFKISTGTEERAISQAKSLFKKKI